VKKFLCQIFILFTLPAFAESELLLTSDTLSHFPNYFTSGWKHIQADDSAMARSDFDDSRWKSVHSTQFVNVNNADSVEAISWFRLHFRADVPVINHPLAMTITHYGASEIYLDGKLLKSFGHIGDRNTTINYDPQEIPFIFSLSDTGQHVIAVRYVNYNASRNIRTFLDPFSGFKIMLGDSDLFIFHRDLKSIILSIFMLLMGIFFTLSLLHLFMFLFYRSERTNLYFSLFMLCIGLGCLVYFINYVTSDPDIEIKVMYPVNSLFCIGCISLSGFINELFLKHKTRFYIITGVAIIAMLLRFLGVLFFGYLTIGLIITVSFEALFTIIFGMIKRMKGVWIIGLGFLFFSAFVLTIMAMSIISWGSFDVDDGTLSGRIIIAFLLLSILSIPLSMSIYQAWRFSIINRDLKSQLETVKVLSEKTLEQEKEKQLMLLNRKEELEKEVTLRTSELVAEKKKSDDLLLNILPAETAEELKSKGTASARNYELVTVMFTDFKNFTRASENMSAEELVNEINYCYSNFDRITTKHNLEKIKTIGDSYMCAGGLPVANSTNAVETVTAAMEIREFMNDEKVRRASEGKPFFEIRIGIHSGPVVAGIVGIKKFAYDIWGDTVNIASRMESNGETGKINVSGATFELIKNDFNCMHRGKIDVKNKGMIDMYFVR
jgi:adenylate cyclase